MRRYDDPAISLDDEGVTIHHYSAPGRARRIPYDDIQSASLIPLGLGSGRYRLVGIPPLRPRHFFHWGPGRRHRTHAISLDVGRWLRVAITPDAPETALEVITANIEERDAAA